MSKRNRQRTSTQGSPVYFSDSSFFLNAEFEGNGEAVVKRGLIMVEGIHVDSKKRRHEFPAERVQRIFNNTIDFLSKGGRVPWQKDHQKTQDHNIGDLEFEAPEDLELRPVTEDDLPNPRLNHLIGKLGIFANRLVAKGEQAVQDVMSKRIKTLSPGIDVAVDIIREISATPTPAIVGLSVFGRHDPEAKFALTLEEAEQSQQDMDALKESCEAQFELLWTVYESASKASEDELQGSPPEDYIAQALQEFSGRLEELLLGPAMQDPYEQDPSGPGPQGPTVGGRSMMPSGRSQLPPQRRPQAAGSFSAAKDRMAFFKRSSRMRQRIGRGGR
jgi:hypothetical protein